MKPGSGLRFLGVFLLFVASLLLLLVTLSAPIIHHLGLLKVNIGHLGDKNRPIYYSFGTFGWCYINGGDHGVDDCSKRQVGYQPNIYLYDKEHIPGDIGSLTSDALTRIMVLHPIAFAVAFVAFLLSIGGGVVASLLGAFAAAVALLLTLIVLATDITAWGILRKHVNDADILGVTAHFGDAMWLLVASFMLLFLGMCIALFTCCLSIREKKRKQVREQEIAAAPRAEITERKKRFGIF